MNRLYASCLSLVMGLAAIAPASAQPAAASPAPLPDFTQIVEQSGAAVVNISSTRKEQQSVQVPQLPPGHPFHDFFRQFGGPGGEREFEVNSLGSGFVISADGYVLTNAHVVDAANEITVKLTDKREFKAKVIGADRRTDVALLKIDAANLPVVRFGNPNTLKVGEWVLAIGQPYGFENSVTAGIVSATGRAFPRESLVPFIQTDVAINQGNSGGPLFNLRGEVVGINSRLVGPGNYIGLSFAIPIDVALDVQQQLRASGRVTRGLIGVAIDNVTQELADSFGLKTAAGALVTGVAEEGPAGKAGVQAGDIILKFDGRPVTTAQDLSRLVRATKPGNKSTIQVWRQGTFKDLTLTVAEMPDAERSARSGRRTQERSTAAPNRLGLVVGEPDEEQKRALRLSGGAEIEEVRGSAKADVQAGDIIVALIAKGQTTEIKSAEQFNKLLGQLDKSTTLTLQLRRGENNVFATFRGENGAQ
jgi:serine protease Do